MRTYEASWYISIYIEQLSGRERRGIDRIHTRAASTLHTTLHVHARKPSPSLAPAAPIIAALRAIRARARARRIIWRALAREVTEEEEGEGEGAAHAHARARAISRKITRKIRATSEKPSLYDHPRRRRKNARLCLRARVPLANWIARR